MSIMWSPEDTIKIIREFRAKECLWNRRLPVYKNKQAKETAYQQIAENMNIPGFGPNDAQRKIKTLRSCFYQEKKKIRISAQSGAEGDSLYVTNLPWYNEMEQLLTCIHESQSLTLTVDIPNSRPSAKPDPNVPPPQLLFEDFEIEIECQNESPTTRTPKRRKLRNTSPSGTTHSPGHNNKPLTSEDPEKYLLTNIVEQLQTISNNSNVQVDKGDCYDNFGKYVSSMLRTIGPPTAMRLQERITSILTNAMCPPDPHTSSHEQANSSDFYQ